LNTFRTSEAEFNAALVNIRRKRIFELRPVPGGF
jgi:hypothetical protein